MTVVKVVLNTKRVVAVRHTYKNARNKVLTLQVQNADINIPKARFHIIVEPFLCMAFGGCKTLAPSIRSRKK